MSEALCPICAVALRADSAEAHLRLELGVPRSRCRLCQATFYCREEARRHDEHPGEADELIQDHPPEVLQKLEALMTLARGGLAEWLKRLCLCGACRLACHEEQDESLKQPCDQQDSSNPRSPSSLKPEERNAESNESTNSALADATSGSEAKESSAAESAVGEAPKSGKEPLTDGLPCGECEGKLVSRMSLRQHVVRWHVQDASFRCRVCPEARKRKALLATHQRVAHRLSLTEETFEVTQRADREVVKRWLETCFGTPKGKVPMRQRCSGCGERVNDCSYRKHAARVHLKEPLHKCRVCGLTSANTSRFTLNHHVTDVHGLQPGPATIDSSGREQYKGTLDVMVKQLFGKGLETVRQDQLSTLQGQEDGETEIEDFKMPVEIAVDQSNVTDSFAADEVAKGVRVTCLECGGLVGRSKVSHHVETRHMGAEDHYRCLRCPFGAKILTKVSIHLSWKHGLKLAAENFARLVPREAVRKRIRDCFGDTRTVAYKTHQCKGCAKQVRILDLKRHVAVEHLKKALFVCRVCGFEVRSVDRGQMNQHLRIRHKRSSAPDTVDEAGFRSQTPVIKAMVSQLFDA